MALPVVERIGLEIVKRLERSRMPGIKVVRPDREGKNYTKSDGTIVVRQDESVENEELSHEGNPPAIAFDCNFEIFCFVRDVSIKSPEYITACNRFAAQINYALTHPETDPGSWYQFGGNSINAKVINKGSFTDENAAAGVNVTLKVTYRVSENDYTEARA